MCLLFFSIEDSIQLFNGNMIQFLYQQIVINNLIHTVIIWIFRKHINSVIYILNTLNENDILGHYAG